MSSSSTNGQSLLDFSKPLPEPPVVDFQAPPKDALNRYDRTRLPGNQHDGAQIPDTFRDAMIVREKVFVQEQEIPLEYEFDEDDPRSAHWVAYSTDGPQPLAIPGRGPTNPAGLPVGTIRLVPFPHPPHPKAGGVYVDNKLVSIQGEGGESTTVVNEPPATTGFARWSFVDRPTTFHDGREPYFKLGRLAVVPSHRNRRLAGYLIEAAINWAIRNPTYFNPANITLDDGGGKPEWKGLILVHAQKTAVRVWRYHGFIEDELMGTWLEEGIEHVGMFRRVNAGPEPAPKLATPQD
jgi:predicted GNAT family N-acyltransferase